MTETEKIKRFVVFRGDYYYPSGGWDDFAASFDTVEEALEFTRTPNVVNRIVLHYDWYQIIDLNTGKVVA